MKDTLKPQRAKQYGRPNKTMSVTIDPLSLDKINHLTEVIKHITNSETVSVSIVIRRAIAALTAHYDKIIEDGGDFPEEEELLRDTINPPDFNYGEIMDDLIKYGHKMSFPEKLKTAYGVYMDESDRRHKERWQRLSHEDIKELLNE